MSATRRPILGRLMAKVAMPDGLTGCWVWTAAKRGERGQECPALWLDGRQQKASRVAYALFNGPIPDGQVIRHTCHNGTACVNPAHLIPGTQKQNMEDKQAGPRAQIGEASSNPKLTACQVEQIRFLYNVVGIFSHRDLGRAYNVDRSLIKRIVDRKVWKHL